MAGGFDTSFSTKASKDYHKLLIIVGPTAVGKTDLAFYLAEKWQAGILNCDSIQMFKELNIGSAKKTNFTEQQKQIPLFLFDEWTAPFVCTAGIFRKKALAILETQLSNRPLIAVGGSGFYIQALEKGMYPVQKVNPDIKYLLTEILNKKDLSHLYTLLKKWDPVYAQKISPQDRYRIFRSLCLILSEMKSMSAIQMDFKKQKLPYPITKIGLFIPREQLIQNVKTRTANMLKAGLLDEVKDLINKGLQSWPLMNSVGYGECVKVLKGLLPEEELQTFIVHRTMRLAKKQMTWFKRDKNITWYDLTKKSFEDIYRELT